MHLWLYRSTMVWTEPVNTWTPKHKHVAVVLRSYGFQWEQKKITIASEYLEALMSMSNYLNIGTGTWGSLAQILVL